MIDYSLVMWRTAEDKQNKTENGISGMAVAYVIGEDVVFTDSVDKWVGDILCSADSFVENSIDESNNTYTVDIIKDGDIVDTVVCDEMIYSLLVSDASVYSIDNGHRHGRLVMQGWKFLDGTFKLPGQYE